MSDVAGSSTPWALVLGDGKPGHENQSLGVLPPGIAPWRFRVNYTGSGARMRAHVAARLRRLSGVAGCFPWPGLIDHGGHLAAQVRRAGPPALVVSTGSGPAPINLLAARHLRRPAVTCMTPAVGLSGFDLALVPAHDRPRPGPGIVTTLGAPNRVNGADLADQGAALRTAHKLRDGRFVSLLLGGDARRHRIPPEVGNAIAQGCRELADATGLGILATTSRRTSAATEDAVVSALATADYVCRGRTDCAYPVPGMLALAALVVVTDDSVSMVSEAASSPARVLAVRVPQVGLIPRRHEAVLTALEAEGYIARCAPEQIVAAGQALLAAPAPAQLDDSQRCRDAVAALLAR